MIASDIGNRNLSDNNQLLLKKIYFNLIKNGFFLGKKLVIEGFTLMIMLTRSSGISNGNVLRLTDSNKYIFLHMWALHPL